MPTLIRTAFIAALFLTFVSISSYGQRLPLRAFTVADGLPNNEINKIVRDSHGFLWFCTAEGLSRFDGYSFTNYGVDQGLPHQNVNDFLETKSGEFWLATNAGLVHFNPRGKASNQIIDANNGEAAQSAMFSLIVPDAKERLSHVVTALLETRDGTIWCGTMSGAFRLERAGKQLHLAHVDLHSSLGPVNITDVIEDRLGSIWICGFGCIFRIWPDGTTAQYGEREGLRRSFHDLFVDHSGRLWAATRENGISQISADATQNPPTIENSYAEKEGLMTGWVSQFFETSDQRFWVATDRGFAEFIPDAPHGQPKFRTYTPRNGLIYYAVNGLAEDMAGNLWLATDAGAMKLARDGFISYGEQAGLLGVFSVFGDNAAKPCFRAAVFGDANISIFEGAKSDLAHPLDKYYTRYGRFDGQSFDWFKPNLKDSYLGWVGEMVTLQAHNGEWWLGTGNGIYRFAPQEFKNLRSAKPLDIYDVRKGLTANQVFRLFEDSRGDIWVSAILPNGLARWDRATETLHDLTNSPGLPAAKEDLARSFGEDRYGDVWVGFSTALARYQNGSFTVFKSEDGLPAGGIQNIYLDHQGRIWLTSSRSGLIRIDDPNSVRPVFKNFTTANGLSSNTTEGITEDLFGHVYVGTGRGVDRVDPATGNVKHYTTADGLADGIVKSGFRDDSGTLWFGTTKGLSRFLPRPVEGPIAAPPVLITELNVAGLEQPVSAVGEADFALGDIASDRSQLQVRFVGLSFASGEVLHYQLMLQGVDGDWSRPTEQRSVTYPRVAPGSYRLLIRALNSDGVPSARPAVITFTILPPLWQRWWFITLVAVAVVAAAFMLYRSRIARVLELANVRTRIAGDLHDDIGANLTKISILSEVARQNTGNGNGESDNPLTSIARISRESVAAMSDIVWAINPQRDSLRDLVRRMRLHAEETCMAQRIELKLQAPKDIEFKLGIEIRRTLYLIFKEALNNAARHSSCSRIEIYLSLDSSALTMSIEDNGKGFDLSAETEGTGLFSMKRRAESIAGKVEIESALAKGTRVRLRLPYARSYRPAWLRR